MGNFFKKHPDFVLIILAVVFVAMLIAYFFWGITTLIVALNKGVNPGKINQPEKELLENLAVIVSAIGPKNIERAYLAPAMGPSVKLLITA